MITLPITELNKELLNRRMSSKDIWFPSKIGDKFFTQNKNILMQTILFLINYNFNYYTEILRS